MKKHEHLPEGWQWTPLGEALRLVSRSESVNPDTVYQLGGVRWYAAGVHVHDTVHGTQIKTPVLSRVIPGDIMYNKMWASKGSFGVAHEQHSGIYVTNEYPQFTVNPTTLNTDYLEQYFHIPRFWKNAKDMSRGTTERARLHPDDFLALEILLPPLDEQCRIAEVLHDMDANINCVEEQIEAAKEVKHGVMQRLFTYGLSGDTTNWERVQLGEIAEINPRRDTLNLSDNECVPFLPMEAINEEAGGIAHIEHRQYSEVSNGYTFFRQGDILFAKITPCMENGKIAIVAGLTKEFGFGSTEYHVIRVSEKADTYFLFAYVSRQRFRREATQHFRGSAGQQRVGKEFLTMYPLALPPLEEQRRIAAVLSTHDATIRNLQAEVASLRDVKRGLMQRLLSGEVCV